MPTYRGLDKVDPNRLQAQRALTEALWSELNKQGVRKGSAGRIEAFFFADDESAAESLVGAFEDWVHEVTPDNDGSTRLRVMLVSPEVALSRDAFLELVDVMMIAAVEYACVFDGFQVDIGTVQRRPWWRLW